MLSAVTSPIATTREALARAVAAPPLVSSKNTSSRIDTSVAPAGKALDVFPALSKADKIR